MSAAKCLILAALASSQLALAAHQADHQAIDPAETCEVCLQFDRHDDVAVDVEGHVVAQSFETIIPVAEKRFASQQRFSLFRARASP